MMMVMHIPESAVPAVGVGNVVQLHQIGSQAEVRDLLLAEDNARLKEGRKEGRGKRAFA